MPALAAMIKAALMWLGTSYLLVVENQLLIKIAAIGMLSTAYVACVLFFSTFITPLVSSLFSTSYGQVVGLAFPPIAGTVVAGIVGLWGCIVTKNYAYKFLKLAAS